MQWSGLTEGKQKNELAQTKIRFIKTKILMKPLGGGEGGQLPAVLRLQISVALQQKTGNFKMATMSRLVQWSEITEGKCKSST
jgi:hypothetical protein